MSISLMSVAADRKGLFELRMELVEMLNTYYTAANAAAARCPSATTSACVTGIGALKL